MKAQRNGTFYRGESLTDGMRIFLPADEEQVLEEVEGVLEGYHFVGGPHHSWNGVVRTDENDIAEVTFTFDEFVEVL